MFIKDIGIDLGTANTLIYLRGRGIIIREPSVVAVNTHTDSAKYVGKEAKEVIGRTPGSIVAVKPLKNGVIADFETTTIMLQEFIRKNIHQSPCHHLCALRRYDGRTACRQGGCRTGRGKICAHRRRSHGGCHRGRTANA